MNLKLIDEFPLDESICYLNHAAVSPWPKRTAQAVQAFAEENITLGASQYPLWELKERELREQLRKLIKAPGSDDIALVKNTSEGLSKIAYGLKWKKGDEIVISDEEFPSNRIVWESLKGLGVKVIEVSLNKNELEAHIASHFNENTRLLAISSIQYASGTRLNLKRMGEHCKTAGVLFCVDAIQSLGAYDFDLEENLADFVIADGHKWLMAPEGLGLFYTRKEIREAMNINEFGWHMVKDAGNYNTKTWEVADTAHKFECGSPNMLGAHGLSASLSLIEDYGIKEIEKKLNDLSDYMRAALLEIPACQLNQHPEKEYQSAIVNFNIEGKNSEALRSALMKQGVICVNRGEGIRFSPHFYTPKEVIDRALRKLKSLL
jgi:selenocysteine lyase/cysteine desulfurase